MLNLGLRLAKGLLSGRAIPSERPKPLELKLTMMMTAAKIVVDVELDDETLSEIEMLRTIRLKHYEKMVQNPEEALETLKRAGLKEESTPAQVAANAFAKISELKQRLSNRELVYEDELSLYVESLDLSEYEANEDSFDK